MRRFAPHSRLLRASAIIHTPTLLRSNSGERTPATAVVRPRAGKSIIATAFVRCRTRERLPAPVVVRSHTRHRIPTTAKVRFTPENRVSQVLKCSSTSWLAKTVPETFVFSWVCLCRYLGALATNCIHPPKLPLDEWLVLLGRAYFIVQSSRVSKVATIPSIIHTFPTPTLDCGRALLLFMISSSNLLKVLFC